MPRGVSLSDDRKWIDDVSNILIREAYAQKFDVRKRKTAKRKNVNADAWKKVYESIKKYKNIKQNTKS